MKRIHKTVLAALLAIATLPGPAAAAEPAPGGPVYAPAIEALNAAFASGDAADIKESLAETFAIKDCPADTYAQALGKAFSMAKGQLTSLTVIKETKTPTGYDLLLQAASGTHISVSVDEQGLFTALNFFAAAVAAPAKVKEGLIAPPFDTVPFELFGGGGLIRIEGEVNGVKGCFIVDTGSSQSMLNSELLPGLKGESIGTQGVSGEVSEASLVTVESLKFGTIEFTGIQALYQPLGHLAFDTPGIKILGLLGYQELSRFEIMLNYPKKNITFLILNEKGERESPAVLPDPLETIRFTLDAHLPVLDCETGGKKLRMGLDSGVEINLIDLKLSKRLARKLQHPQQSEGVGADGTPVKITVGLMPEFSVAGRAYPNMTTMFTDISHLTSGENSMKIDGMIGFPFLSRHRLVSINFVKKELILW